MAPFHYNSRTNKTPLMRFVLSMMDNKRIAEKINKTLQKIKNNCFLEK